MHPPSSVGEGVKISEKSLLGSQKFLFWSEGLYCWGGGGVEGRVTLKKKLKLHKTSIKSILGITNLIYFRDNASAKFCILPMPFS